MNPVYEIQELSGRHLADTRAPDIVGFVDGLFRVAAATGNLSCALAGSKSLRFFVRVPQASRLGLAPVTAQTQTACTVEHEAARIVLRMICARLSVLCRERSSVDVSPYGDKAEIGHELQEDARWAVSYTNTPDRQEFTIEAM